MTTVRRTEVSSSRPPIFDAMTLKSERFCMPIIQPPRPTYNQKRVSGWVFPPGPCQLQSEIVTRDQTIDSLQKKLSAVQYEMDKLLKENMRLNSNLKQAAYSQEVIQQLPPKKNYVMIENRLHQYCECTKNFEKQLAEMENSVQAMKNELQEVRTRRIMSEKNPKVSKTPQPRKPHTAQPTRRKGGNFNVKQCNMKFNSEQPLKELKEQYCKVKEDFKHQTQKLAQKLHKNLDSLIK